MNQTSHCPVCGAAVPEDAPRGLCPRCLLKQASDTVGASVSMQQTLPSAAGSLPREEEDVAVLEETPNRYTYIGERGKGGMGRVLLVHDEHLERDIALKELLPLEEEGPTPSPARHAKDMVARFLREAKITGQLEHPSITPVHEVGRRRDGGLYYTMKLVRGKTLSQAITEAGTLEKRLKLLPHFVDLCQAIAYAHDRGVIHRDIKPSNVMIGDYGETVIIDWGLAKVKEQEDMRGDEMQKTLVAMRSGEEEDAAKTAYGQALGTPVYMPPEQARGDLDAIDERSDIYSLGAVLYEIFTGQTPFSGTSLKRTFDQVQNKEPEPIRRIEHKVPKELAVICAKAMAKDPTKRYDSAKDLAEAVQSWRPRKKRPLAVTVFEVAILTLIVGVPLLVSWADRVASRRLENELRKLKGDGIALSVSDIRMTRSRQEPTLASGKPVFPVLGFLCYWTELYEEALSPELRFHNLPRKPEVIEQLTERHSDLIELLGNLADAPASTREEIIRAMGIKEDEKLNRARPPRLFNAISLLLLDAARFRNEGRLGDCLLRVEQALRLADHARDIPLLAAHYQSTLAVQRTLDFLEEAAKQPGAQTTSIIELLEGIKRRDAFTHCLEVENLAFLQFSGVLSDTPIVHLAGLTALERTRVPHILLTRCTSATTHAYGRWIASSTKPYYAARPDVEQTAAEFIQASESLWNQHPVGAVAIGDVPKLFLSQASHEALVDVARTALLAKAQRDANGTWPESLAALTSAIGEDMPVDPFDGRPLRFRLEDGAVMVYSIGPNRVDDEGKDDGDTDDIVWRIPFRAVSTDL